MSLVVSIEELFSDSIRKGLLSKHTDWEVVRLGDVVKVQNGFAFKSDLFSNEPESGKPLIRIRDVITQDPQTYYTGDYPEEYIVTVGDLVVGMDGDFNSSTWQGEDGLLNQRVCRLVPDESCLLKQFLAYGIGGYLKEINRVTSSITVKHLSSRDVLEIPFPLPPLAEQKRIVAKLDALMEEVDAAREKLDSFPETIKKFRQSVLIKLTSGKSNDSWEDYTLNQLGTWAGGGTPSKSIKDYWSNGDVQWVTPKDMKALFLDNSIDKITEVAVQSSATKLIAENSILFVTRSGILRRTLPISISITKTTVNQDLKALTLNDTFSPKFILYSLIGQETTIRKDCMKSGTTVESIEFDLLKKYKIKVPNLEEQQEIVKKVEALFAYADQLEEAYERAKENIDQLPQSILAKAFKGELVPQDPNDEPASVLLERIQEERAKPKAKKEKKGKTGQMSFT